MSSVLLILVNNNPLIVMHWTSGQKLNIIRITRDSAEKHSSTIIPDRPDTNQMFHTFQRTAPPITPHHPPATSSNWRLILRISTSVFFVLVGWLVSNQRKTFAGSFPIRDSFSFVLLQCNVGKSGDQHWALIFLSLLASSVPHLYLKYLTVNGLQPS